MLEEILEILELGNSIDLWNIEIPKRVKNNNTFYQSKDLFELTGYLRYFYELSKEVEENIPKLSLEQRIDEIYLIYKCTGRIPNTNVKKNLLMVQQLVPG